MSLPAMSLELRFCTSRNGGTAGGRKVSTLSPGNMAASGLSYRSALGVPFLFCARTGLENGLLTMKLFYRPVGATIGQQL